MNLKLGELGSKELKSLYLAIKEERDRRGKKNPAKFDPPEWPIPNKALTNG